MNRKIRSRYSFVFLRRKGAEKRLLGTIRVVMVFTRKVFYFGALIAPFHSLFYRTSHSLRPASQTRHELLTTETIAKLRHECDKSSNSSSAITIALRVSMIYIVTYAVSTMYVCIRVFCKSGLAYRLYNTWTEASKDFYLRQIRCDRVAE